MARAVAPLPDTPARAWLLGGALATLLIPGLAAAPAGAATSWSQPSVFHTGQFLDAATVADFNNDGRADIAVTDGNSTTGTVEVLLSDGRGGLTSAQGSPIDYGTPTINASRSVAAGDFNGDGRQDLVIGIGGNLSEGHIYVLLGNGDGTFVSGTPIDVGIDGETDYMTSGDFNNDGKLDFVAQFGAGPLVFVGSGTGTFVPGPPNDIVDSISKSIAVADFNGDHHLDAITGRDGIVGLGDGTGGFSSPGGLGTMSVGSDQSRLATGDFNRDGKPDLVIANGQGFLAGYVLLGKGDGTFPDDGTPRRLAPPADANTQGLTYTTQVAVADVNSDGIPDVLSTRDLLLSVHIGNGDGTFNLEPGSPQLPAATSPWTLLTPDLDGDGRPDTAILSTYLNNNTVVTMLNTSRPQLDPTPTALTLAAQAGSTTQAIATFTNHGNAAATPGPANIDGPGAATFAVGANTCAGHTVLPGAQCAVAVIFRPQAIGTTNGQLHPGLAGASPAALTGTATAAPSPPRRCVVPRLTGQTIKQARARLRRVHCKLGTIHYRRSSGRPGRVISQSPHTGAVKADNTAVRIVVRRRLRA